MKNRKGITLISLAITIIVIMIIASIATYSGISIINSSKLTAFTTEMKIMQTQVNTLYDNWKNGDEKVLNLGKEISNNEKEKTAFLNAEVTRTEDYRYFDKQTIKELNIEGVDGEFLINIKKRSVISYEGLKYDDTKYYTLQQLPNGLYNVEYEEKNTEKPTFDVNITKHGENKWKIEIINIKYKNGYINKWQVQYHLEGIEDWNETEDSNFIINKPGKYYIKLTKGDIESEEKEISIVNEM